MIIHQLESFLITIASLSFYYKDKLKERAKKSGEKNVSEMDLKVGINGNLLPDDDTVEVHTYLKKKKL